MGAELIDSYPYLKFKYITRAPNHPHRSDDKKNTPIILLNDIYDEIKNSDNFQKISDFFDKETFKSTNDINKKSISSEKTNITVGNDFSGIINIGDKSKIKNRVTIKGNIEHLAKELEKVNVAKSDIEELKTILSTDEPDYKSKKFGNKTINWIQKMIGKALDGTWQVGIETAGGLLAQLLLASYGM